MTSFEMYLFTRLDSLVELCAIFAIIAGTGGAAAIFIFGINGHIEDDDDSKKLVSKIVKRVLPFFIFFLLGAILIPTTKEYAAIYLIPKVVNNEEVQKIPDAALKLFNLKLQQWIGDMTKDNK